MSQRGHRIACDEVRQEFLRLEEERLVPERERAVRSHLAECPACHMAWAEWQSESRVLRDALQPVAPPRDLARDVADELRRTKTWQPSRRQRLALRWGLTAAAAVLVLVLGPVMLRSPGYVQVGQLGVLSGRPMVEQRGARFASVAENGAGVFDGAILTTGQGQRMAVRLADGSSLRLEESTKLRLSGARSPADCGHGLPHVCLRWGEVLCELRSAEYYRAVGTPLGTALLPEAGAERATFRMRFEPGQFARLEVLAGQVDFSCPEGMARAKAGTVWVVDAQLGIPKQLTNETAR